MAHSAIVAGAAILAAGPYGCAESAGAQAFPYFPAATAYNLAQAQNGCTANRLSGLGVLDSATRIKMMSFPTAPGKAAPAKAEPKKKTPAASPKGKKPAAK